MDLYVALIPCKCLLRKLAKIMFYSFPTNRYPVFAQLLIFFEIYHEFPRISL